LLTSTVNVAQVYVSDIKPHANPSTSCELIGHHDEKIA